MIISRYISREIAASFLVVTLVLGLMFLSGTLMRLLADMLQGKYQADLLFTLLGLRSLENMVFILPLALFVAIMMALGRMYRDSEIVVLSACGYGPLQMLKTVALIGLIASLGIGTLSLFVGPWAEDRSVAVMDEAGARIGIEGLEPGQFSSLGSSGSVVYVEHIDTNTKNLYGLFATVQGEHGLSQLTAERGQEYVDRESGDRYLLLQNGFRYEKQQGAREYRITRFAEHGIRIQEREATPSHRRRSAAPTSELWQSSQLVDRVELQWRLAMPLSTLLLALLAVPLSRSAPRKGRMLGLFIGILFYMAYSNMLNVARSAMSKGDLPAWMGLWWVHLSVLILAGILIWRQQRLFRQPQTSAVAES